MPEFEVTVKRTDDEIEKMRTRADFIGLTHYEAIGLLRVLASVLEDEMVLGIKTAKAERELRMIAEAERIRKGE